MITIVLIILLGLYGIELSFFWMKSFLLCKKYNIQGTFYNLSNLQKIRSRVEDRFLVNRW